MNDNNMTQKDDDVKKQDQAARESKVKEDETKREAAAMNREKPADK